MFPIFLMLALSIRTSWAAKTPKPCNFSTFEKIIYCKGLNTQEEMVTTISKEIQKQSANTTKVEVLFISGSTFKPLTFKNINLTDLLQLSIDHSYIQAIDLQAFQNCPSLETLKVVFSKISRIRYGAFLGLPSLKILKLSRMTYIKELPDGIFNELFKLESLDLGGNALQSIERQDLGPLIELQTLNVSGNAIMAITPETFSELGKLKLLDLSANFLTKIEKDTFKGLDSLTTLLLNENGIQDIDPSAFEHMENLAKLQLAYNKIQNLHGALANLNNLRVLVLGSNTHLELEHDTFNGLYNLTDLDLSFCELTRLPIGVFYNLRNLNKLNLRNNQLGNSFPPELSRKLRSIRHVDLSGNRQLPSYGDYTEHKMPLNHIEFDHR